MDGNSKTLGAHALIKRMERSVLKQEPLYQHRFLTYQVVVRKCEVGLTETLKRSSRRDGRGALASIQILDLAMLVHEARRKQDFAWPS